MRKAFVIAPVIALMSLGGPSLAHAKSERSFLLESLMRTAKMIAANAREKVRAARARNASNQASVRRSIENFQMRSQDTRRLQDQLRSQIRITNFQMDAQDTRRRLDLTREAQQRIRDFQQRARDLQQFRRNTGPNR